jgi:hypothetical protein
VTYRESWPEGQVSLEQGTPAVPDDGRYHIVLEGQVVASYRYLQGALKAYKAKKTELGWTPSQRSMTKEQVANMLQDEATTRYQREASQDYKARAVRDAGGKGGRGGV